MNATDSTHHSALLLLFRYIKVYVSNFFSNRLILIKEHCNWSCSLSLPLSLSHSFSDFLSLSFGRLSFRIFDVSASARARVCVSWQKIKTCFHLTQNKAISIFRLCGHCMPEWLVTTGTDDDAAAVAVSCSSGLFGFICFSFVSLMFRLLHSWNE